MGLAGLVSKRLATVRINLGAGQERETPGDGSGDGFLS
jgi:hypothetical protein